MRRLLLTSSLLALALVPATASAQNARARINRGGVTGVEMSIEGGLTATRGGRLRWIVTAYEVVGLSDLRPAASAAIHVSTSLDQQTADAIEIQTDALGRAVLELPIPDDAPDSFAAVLRLVHANGIQRRYDLNVSVRAASVLELHAARNAVPIGGTMRVFGRLSVMGTRVARAGESVRLTLRDSMQRPIGAPVEVTTDAGGLFGHAFRLPNDVSGAVIVDARAGTDEHPVTARTQSAAGRPEPPALIVAVAPERWLTRPGERQYVDVIVRNPEGRPLPNTTVTLDGANRDDPARNGATDARGHVRLSWEAPRYTSGIHDDSIGVTATREGWGSGHGSAFVRVSADANAIAMAVEGGALVPSLGGRVFVRAVQPDGRPMGANVEVRAEGPRLPAGGITARTDAAGVAVLDVSLPRSADATADRCGGETATAIDVHVGSTQLATCLGLDPDAATRVRVAHSIVRAGTDIEVEVDRVAGAARLPVEVTVLSAVGPTAIASALLAPNERTLRVGLPDDVGGLVWVRARPSSATHARSCAAASPVRGSCRATR